MFDPDFQNILNDCRFLDLNIGLSDPQSPFIEYLIGLVKSHQKLDRFHEKKYRTATSVLLANLISKNVQQNYSFLAIPFDNNYYSIARYNPFRVGINVMTNIRDAFEENGLIDVHGGFQDRRHKKGTGRRTRFGITRQFLNLIEQFNMSDTDIITHSAKELILLKDKQGRLIDYKDTDETNLMRSNLTLINNQISRSFNDLYLTDVQLNHLQEHLKLEADKAPIDFTDQTLVRIFNNGTFGEGGRFYRGWWQTVPNRKEYSKLRQYIRIDDYPTREYDYKALHPNLLYIKEGMLMPSDDPYTFVGYEPYRNYFKEVFNAILNAKRRPQFIKSSKLINEMPNDLICSFEEVVCMLEEKHKPIKGYFFSGIGLKLQREDSDLLEVVMLRCIKDDITILPVHDSIISRAAYSLFIQEDMISCFKDKYGAEPAVILDELASNKRSNEAGPLSEQDFEKAFGIPDNYTSYKDRERVWCESNPEYVY